MTVTRSGKEAVAPQIVEAIDIELTAEKVLLPKSRCEIVLFDKGGDALRQGAIDVAQNAVYLAFWRTDDCTGPELVLDIQARLKEVGERPMSYIVDQGCGQKRVAGSVCLSIASNRFQMLQRLLTQM